MALKLGPSFMVVVHNTLVYYYYIGCTKVCRSSIGEMYHGSKQLYCWKYDTICNKVILKQTCSKHYYRILECNAILSLILLSIICNKKEVSWSTVQVFLSTQLWLKLKSRVNALYSTAFNPKVKKERNRLERRNFFFLLLWWVWINHEANLIYTSTRPWSSQKIQSIMLSSSFYLVIHSWHYHFS